MNVIRKLATFTFSTSVLRTVGALCLLSGLAGNLLQMNALGGELLTNAQLLEAMDASEELASAVASALVFQALETCAVPLYAFLMVEGAKHTSNYGKYFLRVLGLAVVCQLPYNLAMTGSLLGFRGLDPVFALVMAMVMVYFFRRFPEKKPAHLAIKALAIVGTFLWSNMLGVAHGAACVLLTAVLWALRGKQNLQTIAGVLVCFACCIFSLYYLVAPLAFLILHFYGGKQGSGSRIVNYAVYPALLVVFGLLAVF